MEAKKSHNLQSINWRSRKVSHIIQFDSKSLIIRDCGWGIWNTLCKSWNESKSPRTRNPNVWGEGQNGFLSSRRESEFTLFHIFLLFVPLRYWMMPNYPMLSGHSFAQSGWHIKPSIRCGKMLNVQSAVLWLGWKQYIPTWLLYLPGKSGWLLARRLHSSSCRRLYGPFHIVTSSPIASDSRDHKVEAMIYFMTCHWNHTQSFSQYIFVDSHQTLFRVGGDLY